MRTSGIAWIVAVTLLLSCAPGRDATTPQRASPQGEPASAPRRISIAIPNEPVVLYYGLAPTSSRGSGALLQDLLHPGLVVRDNENQLRPLLIEAIPSVENGLWQLAPDGRMQMRWRLRSGVTWHDGTPLTAEDLLFTLRVVQDRELPALRNRNYDLIESMESPDPHTIAVSWSRPFIDADQLFSVPLALPLPKHLLEDAYTHSKAGFTEHPYWTDEYVGLGPYRLSQWVRGSHLVVEAFGAYLHGRPKIHEVEARIIGDANTLMSNVLAGSIDLWRGAFLGVDQGLEMRERWQSGQVHVVLNNWVAIYPQHLNANPPAIQHVQLRKALLHAIDRQEMANTLMAGLVPVAHSPFNPAAREYRETEAGIVRYEHDPRRATQLVEALGFVKGADGTLRDAQNQPVTLDIKGTAHREIQVKSLFPVANDWGRLGFNVEPGVIPIQQASDLQGQATFPGFLLVRQGYGWDRISSYHTAEARVPERNFAGRNNGRYMNPDLDALIDRYWVTIPWSERIGVTTQILHHITDQLPVMPLFYDTDIMLIANRLENVASALKGEAQAQAWNAYEWEIK
jgi:peptide/nickel transport system substrate-binding protein